MVSGVWNNANTAADCGQAAAPAAAATELDGDDQRDLRSARLIMPSAR